MQTGVVFGVGAFLASQNQCNLPNPQILFPTSQLQHAGDRLRPGANDRELECGIGLVTAEVSCLAATPFPNTPS